MHITATEFQQNVGRYQDEALQHPVTVTKHGRPHTVLISAGLYARLLAAQPPPAEPQPTPSP